MRFLVIKDPHFRFGFSNQIRKNYERDIVSKLTQLGEYAISNNINSVLIPGDIFDESYSDKWRFIYYQKNIKFLEYFKKKYKLNIYSISGNHDYFNGFENFFNTTNIGGEEITLTTVYGEAVKQGLLHDVSFPMTPVGFPNTSQNIELGNVFITGIKYYSDLSKVKEKLEYINNTALENKYAIVMLHQNVTPGTVNHITQFTYDYLSETYPNINMFLLGHYHIGYEPKQVNNTWFINPYNFTRVNREYEVMINKHIPEFVDITIDNNNPKIQQIKFEATPFDKAFVEDYKVMQKIKQELNSDNDIDLNLDIEEMNSISDEQIISIIAKKENISDEAVEYAIKKSEAL